MKRMSESRPIFLRCIKPNSSKRPHDFNEKFVLLQVITIDITLLYLFIKFELILFKLCLFKILKNSTDYDFYSLFNLEFVYEFIRTKHKNLGKKVREFNK